MVYHIANLSDWENAKTAGVYSCESLTKEGFMHLSRIDQVLFVANSFFKGVHDLVLLEIDPIKIKQALRYEMVNDQVFPHLYSNLNIDAVINVYDFPPSEDGTFQLPSKLQ